MCIRIGTQVGTHPSFSTIVFIGTILRNWESSLGRRVVTSSALALPEAPAPLHSSTQAETSLMLVVCWPAVQTCTHFADNRLQASLRIYWRTGAKTTSMRKQAWHLLLRQREQLKKPARGKIGIFEPCIRVGGSILTVHDADYKDFRLEWRLSDSRTDSTSNHVFRPPRYAARTSSLFHRASGLPSATNRPVSST